MPKMCKHFIFLYLVGIHQRAHASVGEYCDSIMFSCVFPLVIIHAIVSSYSYVILYVSLVIEQLLIVES